MKRGTEPFLRPPKRQEVSNFKDVLAQIQRSGSIYFVESLPKTAIQTLKTQKTATLTLPTQFVRENGDKIEQRVTLRAHSTCGRSARSLVVQLSISARSPGAGRIRIGGGLYAAVASNRLREGDSLIFVPQEDARLEFEVYMFRGPRELPLFPDEGDSASTDEENKNNNQSLLPSPLHHQHEHKKAFTSDIREGKATPVQHTNHLGNHRVHKKAITSDIREGKATPLQHTNHLELLPGFRKKLTTSSIGRSDRDLGGNSGQFEFPKDFMRLHGEQVQASVKFQGIHDDSPIHMITCRSRNERKSENRQRVHLLVSEWSKFVKDNGLKKGHELQFSLIADSYFVVRKV